jgi:hypothetical protein
MHQAAVKPVTRMTTLPLKAALTSLLFASSMAASAVTVTLNAVETGAYTPGAHVRNDYLTGIGSAFGSETHGYLVFDLSSVQGLGGTVTAASLWVQNRYSLNEVGPGEPLPLRIYGLPDVSAANFGVLAGSLYNNFSYMVGNANNLFVNRNVLTADTGTLLQMPLSSAGAQSLNSNRNNSYYAFGMAVTKADAQEPKPLQYVFGGSALPINQVQLVLDITGAVPEPAGAWLLLAGLPILGLWRRRQHKA